jgi:hypothetical protein
LAAYVHFIYGRGNTKNNHVDSGTGSPTNKNEDGYNWWLEEVTELPVGISSAGYTTLYAPVALEISEDVDAYVVSEVQSESVLLTKVTGVVPAETALIIKGEEGNYSFGIRTAKDVTATIAANALRGTVAKSFGLCGIQALNGRDLADGTAGGMILIIGLVSHGNGICHMQIQILRQNRDRNGGAGGGGGGNGEAVILHIKGEGHHSHHQDHPHFGR